MPPKSFRLEAVRLETARKSPRALTGAGGDCRGHPMRDQRTIRQLVRPRFATLRETDPSRIPYVVLNPRVPSTMRSLLRRWPAR